MATYTVRCLACRPLGPGGPACTVGWADGFCDVCHEQQQWVRTLGGDAPAVPVVPLLTPVELARALAWAQRNALIVNHPALGADDWPRLRFERFVLRLHGKTDMRNRVCAAEAAWSWASRQEVATC